MLSSEATWGTRMPDTLTLRDRSVPMIGKGASGAPWG